MKLNESGKNLIKNFEGLRLKAYKCQSGKTTIGYGHTNKVFMDDVITKEEADLLFDKDIENFEKAVNSLVKVNLSQNQFNALVSLVYNIGENNFKNSTLLKKLNNKDYTGAAEQFLVWNKVSKGKRLVESEGLNNRRRKEKEIFSK